MQPGEACVIYASVCSCIQNKPQSTTVTVQLLLHNCKYLSSYRYISNKMQAGYSGSL